MNRIRHIFSSALRCLPLVFAASLAACTAITDDVPADETATISLSITARQESDLNTRNEVGQDHEFIHSLYVYIVSADGTLVKKYMPDLTTNSAAMEGNLRSWTSDPLTIDAGKYTIYAFANLDTYYDGLSANLSGLQEGAQFSELNVDGIVFYDPASKIDFNKGNFIPMSAKKTVTVTPATTGISIGLDRLVSKIRMKISDATPISSLTFGGYANKVGLFPETDLGDDVTYDREYDVVKAGKLGEGNKVEDFYVNCSPAGHKFTVTLGSTEHGGTVYHATTQRDELPRNSIFPLMLQLDDFALQLGIKCWLSPIGAMPTQVKIDPFNDEYMVDVPEGAQVELTLEGVGDLSSGATIQSCEWSFDRDEVTGFAFDEGYDGQDETVKGHITAMKGGTVKLTCDATWTHDGNTYHRTYTVTLNVSMDITDAEFITSGTNAAGNRFGLLWLNTEMLNMSRH